MRYATLGAVLVLVVAGCEFRITDPSPVVTPTAAAAPPAVITITNTNTNTNENDRSDTGPVVTPPTGGTPTPTPTPGAALPLPAYGESTTRAYGAAHPHLVLHSCQTTDGAGAWQFLDGLVAALRAVAGDPRWGYLCKDANCSKVAADVVAYKASDTGRGIWIVDVLGSHCPGPGDSPTQVRWGLLPFELERPWIGVRP